MAYSLQIDVKAGQYLSKLPKTIGQRICGKILETKEDPCRYWTRLEGRHDYKLRIGDYRAIADIDHERKTIKVTMVGHRRNIYE
jgi:mRNA interferase RelE/StbE